MKTNFFALTFLAATLSFPMGANAQTAFQQIEQQNANVQENLKARENEPEVDPALFNPLVLEYKLKSHAKALGNKFGQIAAANKKCDLDGDYFDESELADNLESHSPGSAVSAMGTAYKEGLKAESPSCGKIEEHLNKLLSQAERHKTAIEDLNKQMESMLMKKYGAERG